MNDRALRHQAWLAIKTARECKTCPWKVGDTYQRDCDFPFCSLAPGEAAGYDPYNSFDTRTFIVKTRVDGVTFK